MSKSRKIKFSAPETGKPSTVQNSEETGARLSKANRNALSKHACCKRRWKRNVFRSPSPNFRPNPLLRFDIAKSGRKAKCIGQMRQNGALKMRFLMLLPSKMDCFFLSLYDFCFSENLVRKSGHVRKNKLVREN